ncbi:hypothetical protein [Mycobacterium bourgelatii]|uniref:Uncharacterized protein n=1 Tax=Mycobacterium bourgelatii TaxID=1273442 RepID=A0A7I9YXP7_MYCBU|nr:hypothetical protein [Mycobacterium bourgelatii]MCV6975779.1 hypothetical protein [Mycobacterium bourgelatii]GFG93510.1 hypothetical protein MBOU_55520 [Mycobacterium bourgelatii]
MASWLTGARSLAVEIICTSVAFAPLAGADPAPGQFVNVKAPSPPMRCQLSSDDSDGGDPKVVCQTAGFPQAPMDPMPYPGWVGDPAVLHQNQAIITESGEFTWRTANLGLAPAGQPDTALAIGQTQHLQGWTVVATSDGTTFTNDATGHGMVIDSAYNVRPF